jgi:hypothetical protein
MLCKVCESVELYFRKVENVNTPEGHEALRVRCKKCKSEWLRFRKEEDNGQTSDILCD